jgi:hypothetical protein
LERALRPLAGIPAKIEKEMLARGREAAVTLIRVPRALTPVAESVAWPETYVA